VEYSVGQKLTKDGKGCYRIDTIFENSNVLIIGENEYKNICCFYNIKLENILEKGFELIEN